MQIFVSNSLKFTAIGLVPAKSHACLGFVLTVFMALSGPIVAQAFTPSITLAQMSFICSCSSSLSFPSTKPTCCPRPKSFPMPTRIRAYSCVPISSVMLASPLWPVQVVRYDHEFLCRNLQLVHPVAYSLAAEVHVG